MTPSQQIKLLATLSGRFTEGRLTNIGFDRDAVRRAIGAGIFRCKPQGVLESVPSRLRVARMEAIGITPSSDFVQGDIVQRVVDGEVRTFHVLKAENGRLQIIDPDRPESPEEVDAKEVAKQDADDNSAEPNSAPFV